MVDNRVGYANYLALVIYSIVFATTANMSGCCVSRIPLEHEGRASELSKRPRAPFVSAKGLRGTQRRYALAVERCPKLVCFMLRNPLVEVLMLEPVWSCPDA